MRMCRRPRLLAALLLFACGPQDSGATDTDPLPATSGDGTGLAPAECPAELEPIATPEEFADAYAQALCARVEACECSAVTDTCIADATAEMAGQNAAYLAAGSVFDPVCARKRVLAVEWSACDLDAPSPCGGCDLFSGPLAEGAACELISGYIDLCGPGLFCNGSTCTDSVPLVGEGEACRKDDALIGYCGPDHLCDFDQDICVPMPQVGDPCRDGACGPDAWCSFGDSATGVCRAQKSGGEPCSHPIQCQSLSCEQSVCSDDPRICINL